MTESAKFDEIKKSSMMLSLFSGVDRNTGFFENIPIIRGGEGLIQDKMANLKIEEAFGQLNLPDLFKTFDFFLNTASYEPYKLKEDLLVSPYLYSIKSSYLEDAFLMNLILTPWSDVNLSQLGGKMTNAVKDFAGIFRRSSTDNVEDLIEYRREECEIGSNFLIGYVYNLLFNQREMLGGIEASSKPSDLISVLFQRGTIQYVYSCQGECGHSFNVDKYPKGLTECPDCKGKISDTNIPIFLPTAVSIAYPQFVAEDKEKIKEKLKENSDKLLLPIDLVYLFQSSYLHTEVRLMLNRFIPNIFKFIVPLPHRARFNYVNQREDFLDLYSISRLDGEEILIVTGISNSLLKFPGTLSQMAMRLFVRDLNEGMKKGLTRKQIFKKSVLNEWTLSKWISLDTEGTPTALQSWTDLYNFSEEDVD